MLQQFSLSTGIFSYVDIRIVFTTILFSSCINGLSTYFKCKHLETVRVTYRLKAKGEVFIQL